MRRYVIHDDLEREPRVHDEFHVVASRSDFDRRGSPARAEFPEPRAQAHRAGEEFIRRELTRIVGLLREVLRGIPELHRRPRHRPS